MISPSAPRRPDDATRNERQRLFRARRKAEAEGLTEVVVGSDRYWVAPVAEAQIREIAEDQALTAPDTHPRRR